MENKFFVILMFLFLITGCEKKCSLKAWRQDIELNSYIRLDTTTIRTSSCELGVSFLDGKLDEANVLRGKFSIIDEQVFFESSSNSGLKFCYFDFNLDINQERYIVYNRYYFNGKTDSVINRQYSIILDTVFFDEKHLYSIFKFRFRHYPIHYTKEELVSFVCLSRGILGSYFLISSNGIEPDTIIASKGDIFDNVFNYSKVCFRVLR